MITSQMSSLILIAASQPVASPVVANDPVIAIDQHVLQSDESVTAPESLPIDAAPDRTATDTVETDDISGDLIVVTAAIAPPGDPLARLNAETFEVVQDIDDAVVVPVITVYKDDVPSPVRDGLRNFTNNLSEPVNFVNYLLQFKIGKAAETLGRFTINSTIGLGGVIDVAKKKPFNLPYRANGFSNTLGFYGVDTGAYLYLPIIGSTTVRDLIGDGLDTAFLPFTVGRPFNTIAFSLPVASVRALNRRVEFDDQITQIREEADDPYGATRDQYLADRQTAIDILRGRIPDPLSGKTREQSEGAGAAAEDVPVEETLESASGEVEAETSTTDPAKPDNLSWHRPRPWSGKPVPAWVPNTIQTVSATIVYGRLKLNA